MGTEFGQPRSDEPPRGGTPIGANRLQRDARRARARAGLPLPTAGEEYQLAITRSRMS